MQFPGLGMDQNYGLELFNVVALADLHSVGLVLSQHQIKIYQGEAILVNFWIS